MRIKKVPDDDSILRYVPWAKLRKDEDDNILGILGAAFQLRNGEEYLSATWVDYFSGTPEARIRAAVQALRNSIKVGGKSGFARGKVGAIKGCCEAHSHKIRIVHEPEGDNKAHTAVRRFPRDADELLDLLASESWAELILNKDVN